MKTLKVSEELHQRLKIAAAQTGVELQTLAEIYLTTMLDARARLIFTQAGKDWREWQDPKGGEKL